MLDSGRHGGVEFGATDRAVTIGVEPVEMRRRALADPGLPVFAAGLGSVASGGHSLAHPLTPELGPSFGFLAGDEAVIVHIDLGETGLDIGLDACPGQRTRHRAALLPGDLGDGGDCDERRDGGSCVKDSLHDSSSRERT
jgi:hypothetical protein